MNPTFSLCSSCLSRFRALQFDPEARGVSNLIPFNSRYWIDELPSREDLDFLSHDLCKRSLIRLFSARKALWATGQVPDHAQDFWLQAQQAIPTWLGFRRLVLNPEHHAALRDCHEETSDIVDKLRTHALVFSISDQGDGVVQLTAYPGPKQPSDTAGGQKPGTNRAN
jgi:hypothetical protein